MAKTSSMATSIGCTRSRKLPEIPSAISNISVTTIDHPTVSQDSPISPYPSQSQSSRRVGQCTICHRNLCLTLAGLIYKHGRGCAGGGCEPVPGSVRDSQSGTLSTVPAPSSSSVNSEVTLPVFETKSLFESVVEARCRVLKHIPKASRSLAAEKLASLLERLISTPDNIELWSQLLRFENSCFRVPGERGGKRHLSSLASQVNRAISDFPAISFMKQNKSIPAKKKSEKSFAGIMRFRQD